MIPVLERDLHSSCSAEIEKVIHKIRNNCHEWCCDSRTRVRILNDIRKASDSKVVSKDAVAIHFETPTDH